MVARNRASLDTALDSLRRFPSGNHDGVVADIGRGTGEELVRVMEGFDRLHDRVDILVNDARCMFAKPFVDITLAEWDEVQSRNVRAIKTSDYMTGEMFILDGGGLAAGLAPTGHAPTIPLEP